MQQQHELKNSSPKINVAKLPYKQRAQLCANPTARRLFEIMASKQTNVCVAADVTTKRELLALADQVGPFICMLKTHIDIIQDFDWDLIEQLQRLACKHTFLLFEDRKFADIGNTVKMQYGAGMYKIAEWADIINAHTVPGPGIIAGLKQIGASKNRALILLPQMSSQGTLATGEYTKKTIAMAQDEFVIGFIAREALTNDPTMIHCTPGVKLQSGVDGLGQQYLTPHTAITRGTDLIIVGRGIIRADNPAQMAQQYRDAAWQAYVSAKNKWDNETH